MGQLEPGQRTDIIGGESLKIKRNKELKVVNLCY